MATTIHIRKAIQTRALLVRELPLGLIAVMGLIIVTGLAFIYSATNDFSTGEIAYRTGESYLKKQLFFLCLGALAMLTVAVTDYRKGANAWLVFFGIATLMLIACHVIGREINGAKSWIMVGSFGIQVAEYSKLLYILTLASFFRDRHDLNSLKTLIVPLVVSAVLLFFILTQPDFGTAMVFIPVAFILAWCSGMTIRFIAPVIAGLAALFPVLYFSGLFKDHQMKRIDTWLASLTGTGMDKTGDGYQVWMSQNAIGSGGFGGRGYGEGMFSQYDYLPERHTDFIFSVIAEEQGFVGCLVFIVLFLALLYLCLAVATRTRDSFGRLICVGVATMYFAQFMINVGMTCGIMPVTGIPLPLVSYGGSSLMTSMIALGMVMSVHVHGKRRRDKAGTTRISLR